MLTTKLIKSTHPQLLKPENVLFRSRCFIKAQKAPLVVVDLDPEIEEEIRNGQHYKRVKSFRPKIENTLPAYLLMTVNKLLEERRTSNYLQDVIQMRNRIYHSQLPPEKREVQIYAKEIENKFAAREKSTIEDYEELSEDQKLEIMAQRQKKIETSVRTKIFSWKSYDWKFYQSMVYMGARLAQNFVATRAVFNEIKHQDPDFKPKTLFDFGSGLGTTMHAANEAWPATIHEHVNIESSRDMIDLCDLLLRSNNEHNPRIFNNVFYKQYLPVGRDVTYDLVVSAFTLKELPTVDARITTIENLWHKANDILVFIEHGNQAGTAAILEARSFNLKLNGYDPVAIYTPNENEVETELDKTTVNPNVHIMAPCPHHYVCPRLNKEYGISCNFQAYYFPIECGQAYNLLEKERYSYVVFRKRPRTYRNFPIWPRNVGKNKKSSGVVHLNLCTPQGEIESIDVSKKRNTRNAYDCARACKWGDNFPCKIKQVDKEGVREHIRRKQATKYEDRLARLGIRPVENRRSPQNERPLEDQRSDDEASSDGESDERSPKSSERIS